MGIPNPWVLLGGVIAIIALTSGSYFYGKHVGTSDRIAVENAQTVKNQAQVIDTVRKLADSASQIGAKNEVDQQDLEHLHNQIRSDIARYITPNHDPYVTCGFVRLHDYAASGQTDDSVCAGKSNDDFSDVRLSEVEEMLNHNYNEVCKPNAKQLDNLNAALKAQEQIIQKAH